ncbi:MAG TPA: bifunctional methylenetetrahydrofolate dehydrogenase/methenyltetrahydrofolate cyclohydrolase FolD [Clostridiales bacterium]|nr:bifunctional methylenetetrahydrofolate dehydrogenase/methenyltetrahydrofolate cyclohydrolase FolD [Clostridiales bacterium]
MSIIINGKELALKIRSQIAAEIAAIRAETGKQPGLAVIQVGNDPASTIYVSNKKKACEEIGIRSYGYDLPAETGDDELLELIQTLNADPKVNGILCQLPLPGHRNEFAFIQAISPEKDVDGLHPLNAGLLLQGHDCLVCCTPAGVMAMLKAYEIPVAGKRCVVIGRSNMVGKPVAQLMLKENATVTMAHSKTRDLPALCREADILIAAIGRARFVTADFVKPGAVVIDVGINRDENGKVVGDVDYPAVEPLASAITPVPNGVGPMTIAMLMQNTLLAFKRQEKLI